MRATLVAHTDYGRGCYHIDCPTLASARRQARGIMRRRMAERVEIVRADGQVEVPR
ncbi:MAG TPA: hypothetical protein VIC82_03610 [Candidatus Nanopelagicales bacterium]|jgi:hypothetical protein